MYNCNDFKGLSVLSLYEGDILGYVDKLFFSKDLKRIAELEIVGEEGSRLSLPVKQIYKIGKNAIVVKNNQSVSIKMENAQLNLCPIGSKAYSINGEYLGVVKEITFNEKFITQKMSLDNNSVLDVDKLASCGKNTIIFHNNQKFNLNKYEPAKEPKIFKTEIQQAPKILPTDKEKEENIEINKFTDNSMFLIGRRCKKNIYNFNNEILIKENGVVNKKNLKEIKKYGKIRELMLYIK